MNWTPERKVGKEGRNSLTKCYLTRILNIFRLVLIIRKILVIKAMLVNGIGCQVKFPADSKCISLRITPYYFCLTSIIIIINHTIINTFCSSTSFIWIRGRRDHKSSINFPKIVKTHTYFLRKKLTGRRPCVLYANDPPNYRPVIILMVHNST